MMMSDNLDPVPALGCAMAMMKIEMFGFPKLHHFDFATQLSIVIPRDDDRLTVRGKILQKFSGFRRRSLIVDEVAEDNQAARPIFIDQLHQALGGRRHPPHRDEAASGALAEFVAKMQVGHGEPALRLVEKREAAVEQDFIGNERLIRA